MAGQQRPGPTTPVPEPRVTHFQPFPGGTQHGRTPASTVTREGYTYTPPLCDHTQHVSLFFFSVSVPHTNFSPLRSPINSNASDRSGPRYSATFLSCSTTAPKPLCMYIHTVMHRLSASTHTNHTFHMAPQTHRNQENRTPICYPSVFRAVVCLVSMPIVSSLHYPSSFSAHLNSRQTNPALTQPVPLTAITPHVASPTHHPGQPVLASWRYPELLFVPLTASNTHIVLLPTKSLPFPACLTYSDVNPKFVQFR